jgi:hypothetical protein
VLFAIAHICHPERSRRIFRGGSREPQDKMGTVLFCLAAVARPFAQRSTILSLLIFLGKTKKNRPHFVLHFIHFVAIVLVPGCPAEHD